MALNQSVSETKLPWVLEEERGRKGEVEICLRLPCGQTGGGGPCLPSISITTRNNRVVALLFTNRGIVIRSHGRVSLSHKQERKRRKMVGTKGHHVEQNKPVLFSGKGLACCLPVACLLLACCWPVVCITLNKVSLGCPGYLPVNKPPTLTT